MNFHDVHGDDDCYVDVGDDGGCYDGHGDDLDASHLFIS